MDGHSQVIPMVILILKTVQMSKLLKIQKDRKSTSYNYMIDEAGFKYMAGVGPDNFTSLSNKDIYQDRVAIDGLNLHQFKYKLKPFFKPEEVYNKEDRQYYKGNKGYEIE